MKRILLIATGGTIASVPSSQGLFPALAPEQLLAHVPEIAELCEVRAVALMNIDSTNIRPADWLAMAGCVQAHYGDYDGFVITHGTDTMAYTAAALTYLIQRTGVPVVLTGSQQSISTLNTDARINLISAFRYAADDRSHGVVLVFDGRVIAGPRARKMRTKSFDAFRSIDYPELAVIQDGRILRYINEPKPREGVAFFDSLDERVSVVKLIPGMDAGLLDYLRERGRALVIESFGVGGLPAYGDEAFLSACGRWLSDGKPVVMTTQVPHEGSDLPKYQVGGRVLGQGGVLEAYNMTLEAVVTKLMWILPQTRDAAQVRALFYAPVAHDLLTFD
ncbi:asparaginase [Bacillota bacterium Meth-B3]